MRSRILLLGAGFLLFSVAVGAGFYLAFQLAPERLRAAVEARLAAAAGAPVRLERLDFRWTQDPPGLEAVAGGISLGPDAEGRRLALERVEAPIDLFELLLGRVDASALRIEGAELLLPATPGTDGPLDPFAALRGLAAALRDDPCPWVPLELHGASVRSAVEERPIAHDLNGWLDCGLLPRRGEIHLTGRVPTLGGSAEIERLHVVSGSDAVEVRVSLREVALARVLGRDWSGASDLVVTWRAQRDEADQFEGAARGRDVALSLRSSGETLSSGRPALEFRFEASQDRLVLETARFREPDQPDVLLQGHARLPIGRASDLVLEARTERVSLSAPPSWARTVGRLLARNLQAVELVETGAVRDVRLEARTTLHGLGELLRGRVLARPGELSGELRVDDATLGRTSDGSVAVSDLSGRVLLEPDRLELRDVRGRSVGEALPRLNLLLTGISHLRGFDELHCIRPPSGVPLGGAERLEDWVESRRERQDRRGQPAWQRLRLEIDWLTHPTLICTLERVVAELRPVTGGVRVDLERGVWAGLPLEGTAKLGEQADASGLASVDAQVTLGPPFEGMSPNPPTAPWASGRFELDAERVGDWRIHGGDGRFTIHGSEVELSEGRLRLDPGGVVEGRIVVDIGKPELTFRADATLPETQIEPFLRAAGANETLLTGVVEASASIAGRLIPGAPPLAQAQGPLEIRARGGEIHQRLPILLAIAVASDRFDPFGSRDRIAYDELVLDAEVAYGAIQAGLVHLEAPSLRMAASGTLQVVQPHQIEAVAGIFFFPGLDSVIRRIPIVNRVMLGRNGNLVGAYFRIDGPWREPHASVVPVKSLASAGPAEVLLRDLPAFVWGGIKRIQSVLVPAADEGETGRPKEAG